MDPIVVTGVIALSVVAFIIYTSSGKRFPLINSKERFEIGIAPAKKRFFHHARSLIVQGLQKGTMPDRIFPDAIRMKLTQSLGSVTKPLSEETTTALKSYWIDGSEWHTINTKDTILKLVAQLSSGVFLGDKVCREPATLITANMARNPSAPHGSIPRILSKIHAELQKAREIINLVLVQRAAEKEAAIKQGTTPQRCTDAMEWMEQCAKGRPCDAIAGQLAFSIPSIHTASDMLTQALSDLCGKEELVEALREEARTVIKEEGWQKTTLYKFKLMDSMLKESQRLKPTSMGMVHPDCRMIMR
ncbi:cytochrome P450 [Aspergillus affinis]|uniref:cytochrome P450 n=1 Tax=Aspergillus affinis TaxID=1070780 RepID=UPI0022FF0CB2|nr:cytochrome P450 [Aspergillus affinis]KAI9043900.1 cytochrome P450 [Aspergillus affinis]